MKTNRILIIDDEEFILDSVSKILEGAGFETITASSLEEASQLIQQKKLDLIICDVMLPHIGGFELVDRMKDDPKKKNIPIILMTGMESDILGMTVSNADAIITKPFNSQQLLDEVKKQFEKEYH
jgi:two-component system alkaline phosphatase synthesis response regulator PhoP